MQRQWISRVISVCLAMSLLSSVYAADQVTGKQPEMIKMHAALTQSAEAGYKINPKTPKESSGRAMIRYFPSTGELKFFLFYRKLSGRATMIHFHLGNFGRNGPIIATVCGANKNAILKRCPRHVNAFVGTVWEVPQQYRQAVMNNGVYINIHTALNPKGEIRGQVLSKKAKK